MKIDAGAPIGQGKSGVFIRLNKINNLMKIDYTDCLDFGAGHGAYSLELSKIIKSVVSFDINLDYLKSVKSFDEQNIQVINGNGESLPFKSNTFSSVFLIETLEHIVNIKKAVEEIYRVTKSGATINITVPNKYFILETHHVYIFGKTFDGRLFPFFPMINFFYNKIGAARRFSIKTLKAFFNVEQFELIGYDYMLPPFDNMEFGRKYLKPISAFLEKKRFIFLAPTLVAVFKRL